MERSFSVVIPARNAASELRECLAAIAGLPGPARPREVIVVAASCGRTDHGRSAG